MMGVAEIRKDVLGKAVDAAIDKNIARGFTTGVLVCICFDGEMVYRRAAGLADREANCLMQENTLFRLASISKAFTSLAVAALVEQRKLSLDDSVSKWLPYFTPKLSNGFVPVITIRDLLCHMSGLDYRWAQKEDGPYAKAGVSDGLDITGLTLEENLKRLASAPLCFAPGSSWLYSLGPDVLGAVVAKVQGTDFRTALAELVTKPLGMTDTAFYASESDRKRVAAPYYLDNGKLARMNDDQFLTSVDDRYFHFSPERVFHAEEYPSGGVGLVGTASDLMRLVETIRTGESPIADKGLMSQMSANQLGDMMARPGFGFSLGWGVLVDPVEAVTPQTAGTLAWGGVYGSKWFADPARKLSVVTMTTTALDEVVSVDVRNAIYGSF
ncbi:serine hydrolase domain-containing protein [Oxalobacter formigenes]|uniref:Beta-lactamase n=2 Tax=Oxalobacter formigenes TaxID=847 RepID=C3X9W4_OXAFO|nr:serine hydrolase domain-containing protein [Oxalobacter formigenes]ARQ78092.1 esterase [Oxalobacter formigenes OXCC13]EEO29990.1 beta-lactamase [Oxalobacter formigenes OXCC13]QDX33363.1 beta-lactamase family protein [Oxalobacter formigenes]WAW02507.1 beta-lactamase family protein [Oxalobacter formigenes]WAW02773.1 beta-lactamase family protein [Oxalobacter formigenes]